ncbi:hypothetical protein ACFE04_014634 [Oxalis oulophora]
MDQGNIMAPPSSMMPNATKIYALVLLVVFAFTFLIEWFSHFLFFKQETCRVVARLTQTCMHASWITLACFVMPPVMSFIDGVFLVVGHTLGFLLFGSKSRF